MNSDQIVYNNSGLSNNQGATTTNSLSSSLPHTTAHSYTVHTREERYLEKERTKESKRALKQEKMADKISAKAERQFSKAATKAQSTGMFAERSAMKHEEKAVKLAAAANFHRQAAAESFSEANRAEFLSGLPPRGTLPVNAQSTLPLGSSGLSSSGGLNQSSAFNNQIV